MWRTTLLHTSRFAPAINRSFICIYDDFICIYDGSILFAYMTVELDGGEVEEDVPHHVVAHQPLRT